MKPTKNFLKSIIFLTAGILIISIVKQNNTFRIEDFIQDNIFQGLRAVKITEEKSKIKDKGLSIDIKMPEIHYNNRNVERYINTYIRKNINEFINKQRQISEISKRDYKEDISISYNISFENKNLLNIVIYKNINLDKEQFRLEKDSYVFDLKTGQRIYLDNFLKNNEDYQTVIKKYIDNYVNKNKLDIDKSRIEINKYTNYIIDDESMNVYFNPYKDSNNQHNYEFRIPYSIFNHKIKMVQTNDIVANIDTQTITKNNDYINSVINIPIIITSNKDIEKSINDKVRNDIMKFYNDSQTEANNYYKDFPDKQNKFVANVDFEVKKNSDNILSIVVQYYKYSGGAHGYYENIAYNIDMRTGVNLELSDLFKEESDYKGVIDKEIRRQIEEIVKKNKEYTGIYQFTGIKDKHKFYIQDNNVVIYFDLYEIAPYPAGIPEFPININTISHILKDEYVEVFK